MKRFLISKEKMLKGSKRIDIIVENVIPYLEVFRTVYYI